MIFEKGSLLKLTKKGLTIKDERTKKRTENCKSKDLFPKIRTRDDKTKFYP